MKIRVKFGKEGALIYIGHLDLMRAFQKLFRKAELPVAFSEGFNPHMLMSFAQPLSVGMSSEGEYLDARLKEDIDTEEALKKLKEIVPADLPIYAVKHIPDEKKMGAMTVLSKARYKVFAPVVPNDSSLHTIAIADGLHMESEIEKFLGSEHLISPKMTKTKVEEWDIRPLIHELLFNDNGFELLLSCGSKANLKPQAVIEAFYEFTGMKVPKDLHYRRIEMYSEVGPL
ncbi:MAG: TIGR03936 family radical SAM-associated protein [Lachnospiraceae bacterium]|jgi:radical SAM-linked protein|nr:TIGR03936 family radical SAM-associated protein [Lachnospiraceae bacterium]